MFDELTVSELQAFLLRLRSHLFVEALFYGNLHKMVYINTYGSESDMYSREYVTMLIYWSLYSSIVHKMYNELII